MKFKGYIVILIVIAMFCGISVYAAEESTPLWEAESYDGRDIGIITLVRDQGTSSVCWAYASANASEAYLVKNKMVKSSALSILSPLQIAFAWMNRGSDPLGNTIGVSGGNNYLESEGTPYYAASLFSQWCGPVAENLPHNSNGWENSKYRLLESMRINTDKLKSDKEKQEEIKKAIVKYGAVTFAYNNKREAYYYNPSKESGPDSYPHACTLIGWDDTIEASRFSPGGATQNGGWLVKNSYNSLPYFYISYDNYSSNMYTFAFVEKEKYDYNYFYDMDIEDFAVGSYAAYKRVANIFEAKKGEAGKKEYVSAVNVGLDGENAEVAVKVYKDLKSDSDPTDGVLAAEGVLTTKFQGYYTIELDNPVEVDKGSLFSVVAEINNGDGAYFKLTQNSGKSFANRNSWSTLRFAPRVKAYTKLAEDIISFGDSTVKFSPKSGDAGVFILALYCDDGLEDLQMYEVNDEVRQFNIPQSWEKGKGKKIKGMFWDSLINIVPYCSDKISWQ